jgi:lipid-binding SYLF domain-containing protein
MPFTRTIAVLALLVAGCATAPRSPAERQSLRQSADATLAEMIAHDPAIEAVIRKAPAYAVFPSVGRGGILIGGAYGRGILYEAGTPTGYVSLQQASLGAQLGGESVAELLVLRSTGEIRRLKAGHFTAGANLGVIVISAGATTHAIFDPNASVFVIQRGGLMVDVSITGQQLSYQSFSA